MEYYIKHSLEYKKAMRNIFIILFGMIAISSYSQAPANGFVFPIGSKFTLKLHPVDSLNFNISVINIEPFTEIIDSWNNDHLFKDIEGDDTIVCYFCLATHGDTEEQKEKNMKVYFLFKNYSKISLRYASDIQRKEDGEFTSTSNVGMIPKVKGIEMWPYMIYTIGLHDFQKK